jgi:hypothetical protein
LTYSEQFDNAGWTKQSGVSVTANQTISPDGTQNADLVVGGGSSGIFQSGLTVSTTVANTKSVYLKGVSGGEVVRLQDPNQTLSYTVCTLTTSWQRFTLSEVQSGGVAGLWVTLIPSGGIYMWGAQLEDSSYPTSYIPTTSASATRVADACSKTGISSLIGQTQGTIFWNGSINTIGDFPQLCDLTGAGLSKAIQIYNTIVGGNPKIGIYVQDSSVLLNASNIASISYDTNFKFALAYKNNDYAAYLNGVQVYTNTTTTVPATSDFGISKFGGTAEGSGKKINQVALFPTRLSNSELASLTSL